MEYKIQLLWDNEASVWVATSTDVPGLVLESGSFDALIERVRYAIPELLELNRQKAPFYNRFLKKFGKITLKMSNQQHQFFRQQSGTT